VYVVIIIISCCCIWYWCIILRCGQLSSFTCWVITAYTYYRAIDLLWSSTLLLHRSTLDQNYSTTKPTELIFRHLELH